MEGIGTCSICGAKVGDDEMDSFLDLPICSICMEELAINELPIVEPDNYLSSILEDKGRIVLPRITGLMKTRTKEMGWKLVAMAPFIADQVEEKARKALMESALILMGSSIIRLGEDGSGELADKDASLILLLGQYLDLSVMGRISKENGLIPEHKLHEMILGEEHDHILFHMLKGLDHGGDPEKMTYVLRAMELLRC